jgi:hypothetical protein
VREADRVDPDVDDRSEDYQPGAWREDGSEPAGDTGATNPAAQHRRTD